MASYVSIGTYDASIRIPEFKGLNQYGDGIGTDPRYAVESVGAVTREGILRPAYACELLDGETPKPIETLARLYRRWYTDDHEVMIAAAGGQLYWMLPGGEKWTKLDIPVDYEGDSYQSNVWSWVAYEINPEGSEAPVDVLLMSNAQDGMIYIRGDMLEVGVIATPKKFGVITRYAERIWGGGIAEDPDMLVYSAPYDPFDWTQNDEIPEDGAGDIMQPSWDGDSFTALTPFGSQLIALKKTKVWRVLGTDPGEYVFKEQYGGGTAYAQTVAVDGTRILMLGRDGLMRYDGETVTPYYQEYARKVWERMNVAALDQAFGCLWRGTYYCALPLDGAEKNNAVLVFNTDENTWLLREDVSVEAFLPTEDALYFTSTQEPGRILKWNEDEGSAAVPMRWVSGWQELGYKNIAKGSFTVYLTVECEKEVALKLSMQTEKKPKTKEVTFYPPEDGKEAKQRKVRFGGNGRRFRLIIESEGSAPWKIIGGLQIEAETDVD